MQTAPVGEYFNAFHFGGECEFLMSYRELLRRVPGGMGNTSTVLLPRVRERRVPRVPRVLLPHTAPDVARTTVAPGPSLASVSP